MKTDIKDISTTRKTVTVNFSKDEVAAEAASLVKHFQRMAKIPGFRPGKAPEAMVHARYSKELKDELKQKIVSKAHEEGVAGAEFTVFNIVDLAEGEISPTADATVTFTVDIVPDFELPEYTGLKVTNQSTEVSDEEVTDVVERILNQRAEYNPVEREAAKGDYVRCSYEGKIGDQLIAELVPDAPIFGTQKVTWEEAGAENAPGVQAVVDGLVGMKAGEGKEVTMDFPKDFQPEALAGKKATYSIKVEEVREKVLPELTEDFFKSLQVENEAALREQIKGDIRRRKEQDNANGERQQITEHLLKAVEMPIPQSGIESETEAVLRDFMQRNMRQGVSPEELEKHKEQLYDGASKAAHDRLKSRLILSKIAEKEKIKVENEDLSRMIMHEAMTTRQKPEKLVKDLRKDQGRVNRMRRDILLGKTMDFLVEKAERDGAAKAAAVEAAKS